MTRAFVRSLLVLLWSAAAWAQPTIVSVSCPSGIAHGNTCTLTTTGAGSHADYGGTNGPWLNKAWDDVESTLEAGGWNEDGQNNENTNRVNSGARGGASSWFYRKTHEGSGNQGSLQVLHSGQTGAYYTSFWYREGINSVGELGDDACTKFYRRYLGDPNVDATFNFYLSPHFENATNFVTPPAEINRYSGTSVGGGFPYHPQDVWRFQEVIEYLGNTGGSGVAAYGSADYLEVRLNNARLMRRGTGLASNPVPAEGTDANENQRWVDDPSIGQTGGETKLGSHLCRDPPTPQEPADAHMDFDDFYLDYTRAQVKCGTASTLTSNTGFEMQLPLVWDSSGTSIQIQLNQGAMSTMSSCYLYVTNSTNQTNATGFLITGAGGGGSPATGHARYKARGQVMIIQVGPAVLLLLVVRTVRKARR